MKKIYFKYIIALLLFGSNGIVASRIDLNSYEIVLFRTLTRSLFLIVLFFASGKKLSFHKHKKQFLSLWLSGMAMGTSWIFLYEAYDKIGVGLSSLMYYCGPIFVMILSPLLFKEKLTKAKIISFATVLCGLCLVNGFCFDNQKNTVGIIFGLISAVCYAVMVIFNKKAKNITGLENSMLQLFISFVTVASFTVTKQGFCLNVPKTSIVPILVLGIINTGVGCWFYFSSINKLPVHTIAVCGYIEPLSAVIFSAIFLKEAVTPFRAIGAVLIIGGAIWGELKAPFSEKTFPQKTKNSINKHN